MHPLYEILITFIPTFFLNPPHYRDAYAVSNVLTPLSSIRGAAPSPTNGVFLCFVTEIMRDHQTSNIRRAYQCMKLCVTLSTGYPFARDVLTGLGDRWQWAVNWLNDTVTSVLGAQIVDTSNEGSHDSVFQRTTSAQVRMGCSIFIGILSPMHSVSRIRSSNNAITTRGT